MVRVVDALNKLRPEYAWLSFDIAADIDDLCRNVVFAESDAMDFYCFLNLRPTVGEYVPLNGNIRRVCYLIRKLSKYIRVDDKEEVLTQRGVNGRNLHLQERDIVIYWQTEIAKKCGITYSELCKRSTECGQLKVAGRKQSTKNKKFVVELGEILQKYEQTNNVRT